MTEQHSYQEKIYPLPPTVQRPLWSVMIPTHNCAVYLRETLTSVLSQDPGPELMQIEVVDDHSTKDDPKAVVEELGKGRVGFYQQPQNVGHVKNFQTCLERSQGHIIHLLHGDDYVRDGFYRKLQSAFEQHPEIGAAFCRHLFVDEQGHWDSISALLQSKSGILANWLERIIVGQYIQTPSIAVRREVYEKLGGFDHRFKFYYEDWEMWVRIAAHYPVFYEVEPLAAYRKQPTSNTARSIRTGENVQDVRRGLEIVRSYLPDHLPQKKLNKLLNKNREHSAIFAVETAGRLFKAEEMQAGIIQIWEALRCSLSQRVVRRVVTTLLKTGLRKISPSNDL